MPTLLDPERRDAHVADIGRQVVEALATSDVLLFTSRTLLRGGDADDSLAISRNVSTAVIEVVQARCRRIPPGSSPRAASPPTTSPSVGSASGAPRSSANCCPGMVSVFRPIEASPEAVGTPYVVFAGNVGNDDTLADVIDLFTGTRSDRASVTDRHFAPVEGERHMTTVGWIGLGAMGAPMATCVARAGYAVSAYDIDPQKAVALSADGVKPADTVAAAQPTRMCWS